MMLLLCRVMTGINNVRQMEIFRILAGILHLGNIELKEDAKSSESCSVSVGEVDTSTCAHCCSCFLSLLIGVPWLLKTLNEYQSLAEWLTCRFLNL